MRMIIPGFIVTALALAIDVNLLFKGRMKVMNLQAPFSRGLVFHLLERVQAFRRRSKNYVGYVTEPDSDVTLEGYNRIADIIVRDKTHIVQTDVKEEAAIFFPGGNVRDRLPHHER